ncbi:hypothetical protein [Clostridium sp.]|uniref:hypothetical protein n=1 Tax=Clostridium sp. TaxID=1506 RepID=UPI002FCAA6C7
MLDETAEINYKFIGPIINKDFTICIDIPKSLELLEFKLDGKIVDSKIMSLSEHYNRIYLPITYTSPLTISYKVKVTELVSTKNGAKINFAIRDNATGNHIVQNWFTTTILRVIQELG